MSSNLKSAAGWLEFVNNNFRVGRTKADDEGTYFTTVTLSDGKDATVYSVLFTIVP